MIIKGAKVYGDNFEFSNIDVEINDGKITRIGENLSGDEVIDASGCYLVPGLIDTHMHGAMGKTFIDYEDDTFEKIAEYVASRGTTAFTPALSAATRPKLVSCVKNLRKFVEVDKDGCAMIYGIHLEGPFFAEKFRGRIFLKTSEIPRLTNLTSFAKRRTATQKLSLWHPSFRAQTMLSSAQLRKMSVFLSGIPMLHTKRQSTQSSSVLSREHIPSMQ